MRTLVNNVLSSIHCGIAQPFTAAGFILSLPLMCSFYAYVLSTYFSHLEPPISVILEMPPILLAAYVVVRDGMFTREVKIDPRYSAMIRKVTPHYTQWLLPVMYSTTGAYVCYRYGLMSVSFLLAMKAIIAVTVYRTMLMVKKRKCHCPLCSLVREFEKSEK